MFQFTTFLLSTCLLLTVKEQGLPDLRIQNWKPREAKGAQNKLWKKRKHMADQSADL